MRCPSNRGRFSGKDSALALYESQRGGFGVRALVTCAPPRPKFRAHPISFIELQAQALGLPHQLLTVNQPLDAAYEAGLSGLRDELGVDWVITGDIAEVDGHPNWIGERCAAVGIDVHTPLWGRDRLALLRQMLQAGFRTRVSCVDTRYLSAEWVGRELDDAAIAELQAVRAKTGLDLCGEDGEYHTLVTNGPSFQSAVNIRAYGRRHTGHLAHIEITDMTLTAAQVVPP